MKNILVSTDFSRCALKVALCTAEVAQAAGARLILFHVYRAEHASETEEETDVNSERCVQNRLDKLARKLHKKTGVSITRLMKPVSVSDDTLEVAQLVKANVAVICEQTLQTDAQLSATSYNGMPVITVPTASAPDLDALQQQLATQLNPLGFSPAPLLEAI